MRAIDLAIKHSKKLVPCPKCEFVFVDAIMTSTFGWGRGRARGPYRTAILCPRCKYEGTPSRPETIRDKTTVEIQARENRERFEQAIDGWGTTDIEITTQQEDELIALRQRRETIDNEREQIDKREIEILILEV